MKMQFVKFYSNFEKNRQANAEILGLYELEFNILSCF